MAEPHALRGAGRGPAADPRAAGAAYRYCLALYDEGSLATYSLLDPASSASARAAHRGGVRRAARPAPPRAYDETQGFAPPRAAARPGRPDAAGRARSGAQLAAGPGDRGRTCGASASRAGVTPARDRRRAARSACATCEYIEAERFELLPAPVYLRGFLQEYARAVGLDPRRTADVVPGPPAVVRRPEVGQAVRPRRRRARVAVLRPAPRSDAGGADPRIDSYI